MTKVRVIRLDKDPVELGLTVGGGRSLAMLWPGMGATQRSLSWFNLPAGASTVDMNHHGREAVYCAISGEGHVVDTDSGERHPVRAGLIIYLTPGQGYRLEGPGVFAGGPCPVDPALYANLNHEGGSPHGD